MEKTENEKSFLHIILLITALLLGILLSACSASEEVSQEIIQTAIAETQQANDMVSTIVAATVNAGLPEAPPVNTPEPPPPAYDYSAWKGYHAPEGYSFNFPARFNMDIRQSGDGDFIALVAEGSPPNEISFSISNTRNQGNLGQIREGIDLDASVYQELLSYGMAGFIVEGTVPGEGFGGGSTVYTAYFELGDLLFTLDCPWNFCDRQEFDLILRSFKLN